MTQKLNDEFVAKIKETTVQWIQERRTPHLVGNQELALTGSVDDLAVMQIVLPILIAVCGGSINEILKNTVLKSLTKKKVEEKITQLKGKDLLHVVMIEESSRKDIQELLIRKGIKENDVDDLFVQISSALKLTKIS